MIKFLTRNLAALPALKLQVFVQRELIAKLSHSLERSVERNRKLVEEVASLRKGTMAGFHEAAATALDNVVEATRAELGAYEHEPVLDAAKRVMSLARRLEAERTKALEEVAELKTRLATITRVGGIEETVRRFLPFQPGETLVQACERVRDELRSVTRERDAITDERDEARRKVHELGAQLSKVREELDDATAELAGSRRALQDELAKRDELATAVGHGAG